MGHKSNLVQFLTPFHYFTLKSFQPINITNLDKVKIIVNMTLGPKVRSMILVQLSFQKCHNLSGILYLLSPQIQLLLFNLTLKQNSHTIDLTFVMSYCKEIPKHLAVN
jgi:hypothetical protein